MRQAGHNRTSPETGAAELFSGADEIGKLGREFDWSSTSLGPIESWPTSLKTIVRLCLDSYFPMAVLAGPDLLLIYNKGYPPILGHDRHPWAFGRRKSEVWADVWDQLAPELDRVIQYGESSFHRGRPVTLVRNGQEEEAYFDYSFTPIRDSTGEIIGALNIFQETTESVLTERDLRRMFELSHDLLVVAHTDDRYRRVNSAFTRVLGWSQEEILSKPGTFFIHPDDLRRTVKELEKLTKGEPVTHFENRFRNKDGSYRWLSWEGAPVPEEGLVYAAGRDITHRKQIEEALRQSEGRLADETEALTRLNELNARVGLLSDLSEGLEEILDAIILLVGADKGNIRLLEGDVLKMIVQRGFRQKDIDPHREVSIGDSARSRALLSDGLVVIEDIETDPVGAPYRDFARVAGFRAVVTVVLSARGGKPLGIISTHYTKPHRPDPQTLRRLNLYARQAADLIERKQAEQALRESEERYRSLIRIMPAPVALHLGPDHRFSIVSDAFRVMSGGRTLTGMTPGEAYPEVVGQGIFLDRLDEVFTTGKPWISLETPARFNRWGADTGSSWFNIRYEPVHDANGRVIGVLNLSVDVTDQVRARRELERLLERQAFRVRLADTLRPLENTIDIQRNASRLLGEHLEVDRVMYAEVEGPVDDNFTISAGYRRSDMPRATRHHRFADYGDYVVPALRQGKTIAVADVKEVPEHTEAHLAAYENVAIGAYVVVPLVKGGRIAAYLVVNQRHPRNWTAEEVEMVEETAERTWQAVERAKAETALQRSEAFHRLAVEAGRIGTWDLDLNSNECTISTKMAQLIGYSEDKHLISKDQWVASVQPEDREGLIRAIQDSATGSCPFDYTFRVIHRGDVRWHYSCGDVWRDESAGVARLRGVSIDITERKQTEEALRESEERLRLALDASGMGSFVWHADRRRARVDGIELDRARVDGSKVDGADVDGAEVAGAEVDHQMLALFGLPPDGVFNPEVLPDSIHRADRDQFIDAIARAVDPAGDGVLSLEIRICHPDNSVRWVSVRAQTAFSGQPLRAIRMAGVVADINESKQAEEELYRLNAELRDSDQRKDEFIAMLGHELRNPLAAIRNATELMKLASPDEDGHQRRAHDVLDRQLTHMTRLIDGLLEVSRIARGKIYLDRETLDLRKILEAIVQDHASQAVDSGLKVSCTLPSRPVWIEADQVRLTQVFDNLIGNAIKFTDSPGTITVTLRKQAGNAFVHVSDTGVGIRPEMLERVFEPFQQEVQEIARAAGGLGLGLALAKGLVELHGGSICARSKGPGTGTEFETCLPVARAPAPKQLKEKSEEAVARQILIVEDNADARQTQSDLLTMLGHKVAAVGTGPEALEMLKTYPAEVVLCDLGLPGMSGYDVARAIRADESLRRIHLVALTGYGQPEDRKQTARAGFDNHLTKPVNLEELQSVLQK